DLEAAIIIGDPQIGEMLGDIGAVRRVFHHTVTHTTHATDAVPGGFPARTVVCELLSRDRAQRDIPTISGAASGRTGIIAPIGGLTRIGKLELGSVTPRAGRDRNWVAKGQLPRIATHRSQQRTRRRN